MEIRDILTKRIQQKKIILIKNNRVEYKLPEDIF